jgi:hypothetical protein
MQKPQSYIRLKMSFPYYIVNIGDFVDSGVEEIGHPRDRKVEQFVDPVYFII